VALSARLNGREQESSQPEESIAFPLKKPQQFSQIHLKYRLTIRIMRF